MKARQNLIILWRGMKCRCPQCGCCRLFSGWGNLRQRCEACGLALMSREADTWFFMYISMAFITGLFLIGLLWVLPTPANKRVGQLGIVAAALAVFLVTASFRKGLAIALDYLIDLRLNKSKGLEFRE